MNHNCEDTEALLSGYLDGELTQGDRQRVEIIMEPCQDCAQTLEDMKKLRGEIGGIEYEHMPEAERLKSAKDPVAEAGMNIGQMLVIGGLVLVYGVGAYVLCVDIITDAEFGRTGDVDDKGPLFLRIGLPALIIGLGILFTTVLVQRIKTSKTDPYNDVEI